MGIHVHQPLWEHLSGVTKDCATLRQLSKIQLAMDNYENPNSSKALAALELQREPSLLWPCICKRPWQRVTELLPCHESLHSFRSPALRRRLLFTPPLTWAPRQQHSSPSSSGRHPDPLAEPKTCKLQLCFKWNISSGPSGSRKTSKRFARSCDPPLASPSFSQLHSQANLDGNARKCPLPPGPTQHTWSVPQKSAPSWGPHWSASAVRR